MIQKNESSIEQNQDSLEVQNPSSTLANIKKRKNLIFPFVIVSFIALMIVVFVLKNLLSGFWHKGEKPIDNKAVASTSSNEHIDPFANLDDYRYKEPRQDGTANNQDRGSDPTPSLIVENVAPLIVKSGGSIVASGGNNSSQAARPATFPKQGEYDYLKEITGANSANSKKTQQNEYSALEYGSAKAIVSDLDPNLSIAKGTFIRCSLRTRIVTTIGGEVSCIINNDVYSTSGKVLLIEKGSQVLGHFRSGGDMNLGDARIFAIWNEIRTPRNVTVQIDSNATGALGETGIGGWVDTHFWDRFGAAILISVISDVSNALTTHLEKSNSGNSSSTNLNETRDSASEIVSTVLEKTVNIPPTLYRNQGDIVGIMVSRDLDFSAVYDLRLKRGR